MITKESSHDQLQPGLQACLALPKREKKLTLCCPCQLFAFVLLSSVPLHGRAHPRTATRLPAFSEVQAPSPGFR